MVVLIFFPLEVLFQLAPMVWLDLFSSGSFVPTSINGCPDLLSSGSFIPTGTNGCFNILCVGSFVTTDTNGSLELISFPFVRFSPFDTKWQAVLHTGSNRRKAGMSTNEHFMTYINILYRFIDHSPLVHWLIFSLPFIISLVEVNQAILIYSTDLLITGLLCMG